MAANVNIVVNAQDRASGTLRKVRNAFGEIIQVALGVRLSQTLQRMGEGVRDFATNSIDAAADLQQFQIGVETLIAREQLYADATMGIADAYEYATGVSGEYIKTLQEIALLSPYQFIDVQKSFRQAMAFGFMADEATVFTRATLNMAAGVGASAAQMDRMAYNLAQIRLQGKVTKLDIRQLALAGFDLRSVLQYVGNQMGVSIKTHEDFNRAIAQGKITWADFTRLYGEYADTYFGGASERMARTLFGLRNTFKDIFAVTMPQILGPSLDSLTEFTSKVLDKLLELRDSGILEAWGEKIKAKFDKNIKPVLDYLLLGKIDTENSTIMFLVMLKDLFEHGLFGPEGAEGASVWSYIFQDMTGIDPQPFIRFVDKFGDMIGYLKDGEGLLSDPVLANLGMAFGLEEDTLPNLLDGIKTAAQPIIDWFIERWKDMEPGVMSIWKGLKDNLIPVLKIIGLAIGWIAVELAPILVNWFEQLGVWLSDRGPALEAFFVGLRNIGMIVAGVLVGAWMTLKPILVAVFPYLLGAIGAVVDFIGFLLGGEPAKAGDAFWEIFGNLAAGVFAGLRGLVQGLVELIWKAVTGEDFDWEKFKTTWDQFRAIIAFKLLEAAEAIRYFFSKENWDENIGPAIDDWFLRASEVGHNLMISIGEGFKGAVSSVKTWISDGIQGVIKWVNKFLEFGSPSKPFYDFGVRSMESFAQGLQPEGLLPSGAIGGSVTSPIAAGVGSQAVVINNHYHGLTLNDRLEAETILRPIVKKITR